MRRSHQLEYSHDKQSSKQQNALYLFPQDLVTELEMLMAQDK